MRVLHGKGVRIMRENEKKENKKNRDEQIETENKTSDTKKKFFNSGESKFRITPMKLYLYILAVLLSVKIIFDIRGFGDFVSKAVAFIISILGYLVIGLAIAYILNAYMLIWENRIFRKLKKPKLKRALSIVIAYLTLILFISLLLFAIIPTLTDTVKSFASDIPDAFSKLMDFYNDIVEGDRFNLSEDIRNTIRNNIQGMQDTVMSWFSAEKITGFITSFFSTTVSSIFNIVMGLIVSVYMLIEKDSAVRMMKRVNYALFSKRHADNVQWCASQSNKILKQYFTGKLIQALIILVLSYILFLIANVKYAILLAVIMAVMNMIPYIGPWLGGAIVVFISLPQGKYGIIAALVCILIVQAADNWFVSPKIVGGRMGISPLLVLAGLCIGGGLFGLPGLILGDVMAAIFKTIFYDRYLENKLQNKIKNGVLTKEFENDES